jgi:pimeloyl-ACP methyl ester carboxylesterase
VSAPDLPAVVRRDLDTPAGPLALLETVTIGRPVLMVPGYTGSKEDFVVVLPLLAAAGYRVVAMDLPGQFESAGPDDPAAYQIDRLARDVLAVADRLGGPVHLLGHSFGGLVARAATVADPTAITSLTLLDSGPSAIGGNRKERMDALEPLLAAGGMIAVYQAMELIAVGDEKWLTSSPEAKAFQKRRFLASSPVGLQAMGEALRSEPDRVAQLRATGVPVLVAYGEADDAWPPAVQAEMARRLDARRAVIPAAVHSPAMENPAETVRVLLDFWSSAEGRVE